MSPQIDPSAPYKHLHRDDVEWLLGELEKINERVTDLFSSNLSAIPDDLDGLNSVYIALELEIGFRELEALNGTSLFVDTEEGLDD